VARVATYTTGPFDRDREFTGHGALVLHGSTDQRDMDVYAKIQILSFLVKKGERLRLELSNFDSQIADAPMTHWYGQKIGTDSYHHDRAHPSRIILPERPRA
jgi:predicted acyl esterase